MPLTLSSHVPSKDVTFFRKVRSIGFGMRALSRWCFVCVVAASTFVCEISIAAQPPLAGGACSNWGETTSVVVEPMLTCSHGVWANTFKLHQYATFVSARSSTGELEFGYPIVSQAGVPGRFSRYNKEGGVITGYAVSLTVSETSDAGTVRIEGKIWSASRDGSWSKDIDVTTQIGQTKTIGIRPDGTAYTFQVSQLPNP